MQLIDLERDFGKPISDFTRDDWRIAADWFEERGQDEEARLIRSYVRRGDRGLPLLHYPVIGRLKSMVRSRDR